MRMPRPSVSTDANRAALTAYHAELAAAFARRLCACGAPALSVKIGDERTPDFHLCENCFTERLAFVAHKG